MENGEKDAKEVLDYYEFLQISPNAEPVTITRVYRFLASRLHPDNPATGDAEQFRLLKEAYDTLSDRLTVLALLYMKRRTNPYNPEVSLAEVEKRMGFPRDYLQFTTWYLWNKKYITQADNSDFTLTALGVDFVEANRAHVPILNKLLTDGSASSSADAADKNRALNPARSPTIIAANGAPSEGTGTKSIG